MLLALLLGLTTMSLSAEPSPARKPNHLIHEKSPYLQQHAYNPVDWHPWGPEAFQKARRENKPIFLSIGYSTCHWCHVMEEESFSSPDIAAVLNKYFVAVKVDREERPDIDKVYMTAAAGAGWGRGWPLSLWLTPELKPFFGGTYFPAQAQSGRPGFQEFLEQIAGLWRTKRSDLAREADQISRELKREARIEGRSGPLDSAALDDGYRAFEAGFDPAHGGFGGAPKFPMPSNQAFLLRYFARTGEKRALEMVRRTLGAMTQGGLYDHLGGGFHRYSTDERWRVPHFEKMLYDNAQLAVNNLEAFQATKDESLAAAARQTLDYLLRDLAAPEGGFYSAQDADSFPAMGGEKREEGAFYLWTSDEIREAAGRGNGEIFSYRYGVEPKGKSILYAAHTLGETAEKFGKSEAAAGAAIDEAKQALLQARSKRPLPRRDEKVLVSWNGLAISALAKASQVLDEPKYLEAAAKAARFIREKLYDAKTGRLYRRWREGERKVPGLAADYAFLVQGVLDLYEASLDPSWINWAVQLTDAQNALFLDPQEGGFYMTAPGHDGHLLVRVKEDSDNVEPAAGSVAALNLLRLAQFTGRKDFRAAAEKTLILFGAQMREEPRSLPLLLCALDYALAKPKQIVIAGGDQASTHEMLRQVHERFIPNKILMLVEPGRTRETFSKWLPFLRDVKPIAGKATAYVCVDYACALPTNDLRVFKSILDGQ